MSDIVGRDVLAKIRENPQRFADHLHWLRFARARRLAGDSNNDVAAQEMSCAIGDLLRALGADE